MGSEPGQDSTAPETRRFLTAAEYFLQRRSFADCCKYAARARACDPTNATAARLLCTATVLSASKISSTRHDYYAVLNLPYFESDASRIGSSFETLSSILDPNSNMCPFSSEAFDLVVRAWSVLSNSVEKAKFDGELSSYMGGRGGGTFWTMCPYCYYVYEYDAIFEDCCLRCANEKCRRLLHAVPIGGAPPPDVVAKGEYCCPGFMPLAVRGSNGDEIREKLWLPFAPSHCVGKGLDLNSACNEDSVVVDDDKVEMTGFQDHGNGKMAIMEGEDGNGDGNRDANGDDDKVEMTGFQDHGNEKLAIFEGEDGNGDCNRDANGDDDKVEMTGFQDHVNGKKAIFEVEDGNGDGNRDANGERIRMARNKSVLWKSKKLLGRGIRIDHDQAHILYGVREECRSYIDSEPYASGETVDEVEDGMQFLQGDDDVFIRLPTDYDLGNGRPMSL